jgi:hypothetical protein
MKEVKADGNGVNQIGGCAVAAAYFKRETLS